VGGDCNGGCAFDQGDGIPAGVSRCSLWRMLVEYAVHRDDEGNAIGGQVAYRKPNGLTGSGLRWYVLLSQLQEIGWSGIGEVHGVALYVLETFCQAIRPPESLAFANVLCFFDAGHGEEVVDARSGVLWYMVDDVSRLVVVLVGGQRLDGDEIT
jgi:hypothetical protein